MPSRTYIEMYAENADVLNICKTLFIALEPYIEYIRINNLQEYIVQKRVEFMKTIFKPFKGMMKSYQWVLLEKQIIVNYILDNNNDDYEYYMKRAFPKNAKPYKFMGHNIQFVSYDEHLAMHHGDKEVVNDSRN